MVIKIILENYLFKVPTFKILIHLQYQLEVDKTWFKRWEWVFKKEIAIT